MPGPPPPPPPGANFGGSSSGSADQGRGLLLQSIRAGKTLKKTVTVDKSAPAVCGKVKGEASSSTSNVSGSSSSSVNNTTSVNTGGPMALGGLFSNGMPKLKPTGLRENIIERDAKSSVNNSPFSNTHSATMPNIKRGPPPVPPPATQKPQVFQQSGGDTFTNTDSLRGYGKPTLAPKPPSAQQKPSPPPKKLNLTSGGSVSRAQSMRLPPRSPPVLAPTPPSLHQSQDYLNETPPRPSNRVLRPPIARPPSPPTSRPSSTTTTITRVAPPPPSRVTVTAPNMPPPPPPFPHRPAPTHQRLAPPPPPPPTPPTRSLTLRNGQTTSNTATTVDLEVRFAEMFRSVSSFPPPEPFRGFAKVYSSRNAAKQQAPAPPLQSSSTPGSMLPVNVSSGGKQWPHNATSLAY